MLSVFLSLVQIILHFHPSGFVNKTGGRLMDGRSFFILMIVCAVGIFVADPGQMLKTLALPNLLMPLARILSDRI